MTTPWNSKHLGYAFLFLGGMSLACGGSEAVSTQVEPSTGTDTEDSDATGSTSDSSESTSIGMECSAVNAEDGECPAAHPYCIEGVCTSCTAAPEDFCENTLGQYCEVETGQCKTPASCTSHEDAACGQAACHLGEGTCFPPTTVFYVDNQQACPGQGTENEPFCSFEVALAQIPAVATTLRVRGGMEYAETVIARNGQVLAVLADDPATPPVLVSNGNDAGAHVSTDATLFLHRVHIHGVNNQQTQMEDIDSGVRCQNANLYLTSSEVVESGFLGLDLDACNATIRNSLVQKNTLAGIDAQGTTLHLEQSQVLDNNLHGINFQGGQLVAQDVEVSANGLYGLHLIGGTHTIAQSQFSANGWTGLLTSQGSITSVHQSTAHDNAHAGIVATASELNIEGGDVYNNGWSGIGAGDGSVVSIHKTKAYDNTENGINISASEVTIQDGDVYNNSWSGIGAGNGSIVSIHTTKLHHNLLHGIITIASELTFASGDVYNNTWYGIVAEGGSKATIHTTKLHQNIRHGIVANASEVTIENSDVYSNGSDSGGWAGIAAFQGAFLSVKATRIYNNELFGIGLVNTSGLFMEDGDIYENFDSGIIIEPGGVASIYRTRIHDNKSHGVRVLSGNLIAEGSEFHNNQASAIIAEPGNLTLKACNLHDNMGNGVFLNNASSLNLTNSLIVGNGQNNADMTAGIRLGDSESSFQMNYSTVIENISTTKTPSILCLAANSTPSEIRNSIIKTANSDSLDTIHCQGLTIANSAIDTGFKGDNLTDIAPTPLTDLFINSPTDLHLTGTLLKECGIWKDGDPESDFEGNLRPNVDGQADACGAYTIP